MGRIETEAEWRRRRLEIDLQIGEQESRELERRIARTLATTREILDRICPK